MSSCIGARRIIKAFLKGEVKRLKNDFSDGITLTYHGNAIARFVYAFRLDGPVIMGLAGWGTPTTRDRLNALCDELFDCRPWGQMNYEQYFGSMRISTLNCITFYPSVLKLPRDQRVEALISMNVLLQQQEAA
jgi:hypothetical protein